MLVVPEEEVPPLEEAVILLREADRKQSEVLQRIWIRPDKERNGVSHMNEWLNREIRY